MLTNVVSALRNSRVRLWLYSVACAALAVLVGYGIVEADKVPLWLGLIGALGMVGNGTAAVSLHGQRRDGTL